MQIVVACVEIKILPRVLPARQERGRHFRRPRPRRVAGAGLEVAELDGVVAAVVARGVAHRVD